MTLPLSGNPISIDIINTEIGRATTYSEDLNFLNSLIQPGQAAGTGTGQTGIAVDSQRPSTPNMAAFYGKTYFQANIYGNCNNSNLGLCNCNSGDATHNCHACYNCGNLNCANCDGQSYLQAGTNCACTYNCSTSQCYLENCNCNCNCTACACACSDERLKYGIETIGGALDKVSALRGVYFNWNDNAPFYGLKAHQRSTGVIADEVERVLPEVIFGYKDMKSVDYGAINGLLIEAIKELKNEVNELKSRKNNVI